MVDATTSRNMSPKLLEVVDRAKRQPEARFNSLAYLIDVPALKRAYGRMRKDAAVGVDEKGAQQKRLEGLRDAGTIERSEIA